MLVAATFLAACSTDGTEVDGGYIDEDGKFVPKTEVWTVTIEPEYVLNHSYWGAYTGPGIQMEAIDLTGKTVGTFFLDEIQGFKFEEGYRYEQDVCRHPHGRSARGDDGREDGEDDAT